MFGPTGRVSLLLGELSGPQLFILGLDHHEARMPVLMARISALPHSMKVEASCELKSVNQMTWREQCGDP